MTELMEIREFIQAYVEAVSSILEAEVTVVDSELVRVGATGIYKSQNGLKIAHDSFFKSVITSKISGVIPDVKKEFMCNKCDKRDTCKELANLAYPIFLEDKVIGVIGIIAFCEKQRERLLKDHNKLEEFVKYMSVLIESKIVTHRLSLKLESQINEVIKEETSQIIKNKFIGNNQKIEDILTLINKIAHSNSTVLISGESGTGKEVIAKLIHSQSDRNKELMISINCSAIPEQLVESELFGYEEGSFTGSKKGGHIGKFELANNSTLFLDEVGEMPLHIQTKLLRVLQEHQVERIGSKKPIPIDVRVICATNRNLVEMVQAGTFRKDLYYRLNVIPITIPPLRERKDDIPLLVNHFIKSYNKKLKKDIKGVSKEAMKLLVEYEWQGNVRELKNLIEYLENIIDSEIINVKDLPNNFLIVGDNIQTGRKLSDIMNDYEKIILGNLIKKADTTEKKINLANQLGISKATLYRKLAEYGI